MTLISESSRMKSELLVDTNMLIYSVDSDSKYYIRSRRLLYESEYELFTTSKNCAEFLSSVTRTDPPMPLRKALSYVREFQASMKILYPSKVSSLHFDLLLEKYKPMGLKIHDYEIAAIGLAHNVTQIATLNVRDFKAIEEITIVGFETET